MNYDKELYDKCLRYANFLVNKYGSCLYNKYDLVNNFFFTEQVTELNYKSLCIRNLKRKTGIEVRCDIDIAHKLKDKRINDYLCSNCNEIKPSGCFYIYKNKPHNNCKECLSIKSKQKSVESRARNKKKLTEIEIKETQELIIFLQKKLNNLIT